MGLGKILGNIPGEAGETLPGLLNHSKLRCRGWDQCSDIMLEMEAGAKSCRPRGHDEESPFYSKCNENPMKNLEQNLD